MTYSKEWGYFSVAFGCLVAGALNQLLWPESTDVTYWKTLFAVFFGLGWFEFWEVFE